MNLGLLSHALMVSLGCLLGSWGRGATNAMIPFDFHTRNFDMLPLRILFWGYF